MEVIETMRQVEGVAEWKGRGIQVKAETWKVLEDWRATELARIQEQVGGEGEASGPRVGDGGSVVGYGIGLDPRADS
jgi:hypothetical protein